VILYSEGQSMLCATYRGRVYHGCNSNRQLLYWHIYVYHSSSFVLILPAVCDADLTFSFTDDADGLIC